ncbi:hypothetical protein, partial [Burkholderia cepacia]
MESRLDPIVVFVNSKWMDVWMAGLGRRQRAVQGQPDRSDLRQSRKGILENRHPGPSSSSSHATDPDHSRISAAEMQKPPPCRAGVSGLGSLTITYFHTGIRTIIGVESFHG